MTEQQGQPPTGEGKRAMSQTKAVKAALREAFPGTEFSVTAKVYSMGGTLNISWTDGPSRRDVSDAVRFANTGWFRFHHDVTTNDECMLHHEVTGQW